MNGPSQEDLFVRDAQHLLGQAGCLNQWMADVLEKFVGRRVLEIGSGLGHITGHLSPRRELYVASDIDPYFRRRIEERFSASPNVKTAQVDLLRSEDFAPFERGLDTIICLNVLEHIDDHESALRNMQRALAPGGRLLLLLPQGAWLYGTIDELAGHRRRYHQGELRRLLVKAGFSVERMFGFNRAGTPGWYLNGKILKRSYFGKKQLKTFDSLVWLFRRIDAFLPWPAQSIIAVAQKTAD
ncbi:MAG: hypothetical protein A3J74_10365 [Elusimicrobia bacterium RIFCSPHIGHO2_02_FULL_57_9]|nr:MAG: hypothetical protein A3J74_10365 [Elusimicrobia bacterium RIFCSPHIGHO2_02_FULL_57_9]